MARRTKKIRKNSAQVRQADVDVATIEFKDKLERSMYEYGMYVIEDRAIAEIHDGLKPVHRRALWSAYNMGAKSTGATIKVARMIGDICGKYHPHGDAAVHQTIANMVEGAYCPLFIGQGNFGSYSKKDPPGAPRYIEAKLNRIAEQVLLDPHYLKVVPMVPNYDGKDTEPAWLPAKLPMILATGTQGIAVGLSTKMPAYTLSSLRKVVMAMLKGETNSKKLSNALQFATRYGGAVVSNAQERHTAFTTAEGAQLQWSCDYSIEGEHKLIITGLHPDWNFDSTWEKFVEHPDVASASNFTSKHGIRLEVTLKKSAPEDAIDKLIKLCVGKITYRCSVIERSIDHQPEIPEIRGRLAAMSPFAILQWWIKWRLQLERDALRQQMIELKASLIRERLLLLACQSLDVIFALLKARSGDKVVQLAKKLDITEEDARLIWGIAVGRLDKLSAAEQAKKIKQLRATAKQVKADFAKPTRPVLANLQQMQLD